MTGSIDNALDELDARLREVKREHGQVLMLEAFRRQVRDGATTRGDDCDTSGLRRRRRRGRWREHFAEAMAGAHLELVVDVAEVGLDGLFGDNRV